MTEGNLLPHLKELIKKANTNLPIGLWLHMRMFLSNPVDYAVDR